ncbi:MAG: hypothetical protein R3C04_08500 [Hyphomonas sp.]
MGTTVVPIRGLREASWALSGGVITYLILGGVTLMICFALMAAGIDPAFERILSR